MLPELSLPELELPVLAPPLLDMPLEPEVAELSDDPVPPMDEEPLEPDMPDDPAVPDMLELPEPAEPYPLLSVEDELWATAMPEPSAEIKSAVKSLFICVPQDLL